MASSDNDEVLVDFDGRSLKVDNEKDANEIVENIKKDYMMSALRLSANTIGVNGAKAIGDELAFHKNLKRCLFSDIFTGRLVDEIAPALMHFSKGIMTSGARLTELDLSDNAFGPRGVVGVTELLSSPACFTLKILRMNNQGLGHQGAKHLAEALSKGLKESDGKGLKLTHFSAGRNRLENYGACLLADVFAQMGSLEELALYQNGIGIHGPEGMKALASAISQNSNMRILNLSDNSLKEEGGSEVAKILKSIPSLEELILDDCLIRSKGCRALAHYIEREDIVPSLTRLSLYGNEIKRDSAISLAFALVSKSQLNHLCLNANEFGPSGIQAILQVLESLNLLPALRASISRQGEDEEEDDDDDLLLAFDEDIGEDQEESEVENEDEEQSYDGDYYGDDNGTTSEDEGEDNERDTSFNTVKYMPTKLSGEPAAAQAGQGAGAGGFSFLSCLSSLKENQQPTKSGLFADINMLGSSTSSPSGGLFGGLGTTNFSGGLFAPPKLGSLSSGLFSTPADFNESALLDSLRATFSDTEDENMITSLIDQVSKQAPPSTWKLQGESIVDWASPESLVRLAFRISQKTSAPACQNLASDLIFSALSQKTNSVDTSFVEPASRAVNSILLHVGAIKADKSDSLERKINEEIEDQKTMKTNVNLVSSLLNRYGDNLSADVKKPLKCIISLRRNQSTALETLLTTLESKMSSLNLMNQFVKRFLLASSAFTTGCVVTATGICLWDKESSVRRVVSRTAPPGHSLNSPRSSIFSPYSPLPPAVAQVGLPDPEPLKILPGYICQYDRRNRIPRWTLELLVKENLLGDSNELVSRENFAFIEDLSEPAAFRSTNVDYARSGYDRGHMAAAGNNLFNAECMDSTFLFCNIAPQVGRGFNRNIWNSLEKHIRKIARNSANVVVVTGPLFIPGSTVSDLGHRLVVYELIGPNSVAVPTHFFKAIAVQERRGGPWNTFAWIIPNRELPMEKPFNAFAVSMKNLEQAAGLVIFPNLTKT
ncbi:unnamed protein product [Rodentolepis nana]|uniref:Ran GTPase-activating protein 1 n=1 Tax=Rodentolepis nana TaxID=102285 RepID=A0A0R3T1K9_RODNA|nr:unnamed protein product [Rodentolepis nana]